MVYCISLRLYLPCAIEPIASKIEHEQEVDVAPSKKLWLMRMARLIQRQEPLVELALHADFHPVHVKPTCGPWNEWYSSPSLAYPRLEKTCVKAELPR